MKYGFMVLSVLISAPTFAASSHSLLDNAKSVCLNLMDNQIQYQQKRVASLQAILKSPSMQQCQTNKNDDGACDDLRTQFEAEQADSFSPAANMMSLDCSNVILSAINASSVEPDVDSKTQKVLTEPIKELLALDSLGQVESHRFVALSNVDADNGHAGQSASVLLATYLQSDLAMSLAYIQINQKAEASVRSVR